MVNICFGFFFVCFPNKFSLAPLDGGLLCHIQHRPLRSGLFCYRSEHFRSSRAGFAVPQGERDALVPWGYFGGQQNGFAEAPRGYPSE